MPPERIEGAGERDEVTRDESRPLVDQLVEGMLSVGSRLSPVDRPGRVIDFAPCQRDVLAVALHRQLLEIRWEALQVLLVRQDGDRLGAEEVRVPNRQQTEEHREIALERRTAEMLVHLMKAVEQRAEILR